MLVAGIFTQMSGSLGGITASRNSAGSYLRSRTVPVNPATPFQETVRQATAQLTDNWENLLTAAQRVGWRTYAANVPIPGKLGSPVSVQGLSMYVRSNVPRIQSALARVDDAPTNFTLGSFVEPTFIATASADTVDVTFDNTDAWANETGSAMLLYFSRPQNGSIIFFKGPYRLAGTIAGDDTTAPTSPATIAAPFPFTAANNVFAAVRVSRVDGRLSTQFRGFSLAI